MLPEDDLHEVLDSQEMEELRVGVGCMGAMYVPQKRRIGPRRTDRRRRPVVAVVIACESLVAPSHYGFVENCWLAADVFHDGDGDDIPAVHMGLLSDDNTQCSALEPNNPIAAQG